MEGDFVKSSAKVTPFCIIVSSVGHDVIGSVKSAGNE
jgi:hypothetical protein